MYLFTTNTEKGLKMNNSPYSLGFYDYISNCWQSVYSDLTLLKNGTKEYQDKLDILKGLDNDQSRMLHNSRLLTELRDRRKKTGEFTDRELLLGRERRRK